MTGTPAIPGDEENGAFPLDAMREVVGRLMSGEVEGIARVAFDLTPKPPGTTEWE